MILIGFILLAFFIFHMIEVRNKKDVITSDHTSTSDNETEITDSKPIIPTGPFGKYEYDGKQCLTIDEIIERGDCFQEVFEKHLVWYLNEEKVEFYFPFQREQSHWHDVFYVEIDEDDQLSELQETDYFHKYDDPYPHNNSNHDRGKKIVDEYWHIFSNLIPKEYREHLKYIYWTDTGDDLVLAVGVKEDEVEAMTLLFSHQLLSYKPYLRYSFLHEYGHIFTLNETQTKINEELFLEEEPSEEQLKQDKESCKTYYHNGRCSYEDSYLFQYFQRFWADIYEQYQKIDWDNQKEYEEFFFTHEERFFNSYQGTSPPEDIADTFAFFVHSHSSIGAQPEMKYQKIKFFYEYEELVELRTTILENLYHLSIEDEEFY